MKLSEQCCTLDQAKRLKELGVIQKSLFYHHPNFDKPVFGEEWTTKSGTQYSRVMVCNDKKGSHSAYTVAELGVMLPDMIETDRQYELVTIKEDDCWLTRYVAGNDLKNAHPSYQAETSEAEARAAILIWLFENKIITAEEVNNRLNQ
jgi:hypothetical protein